MPVIESMRWSSIVKMYLGAILIFRKTSAYQQHEKNLKSQAV